MNFKRVSKFTDRDGKKYAQIDREIDEAVNLLNRHNAGVVGWDNLSVKDGSNKRMGQAVLVGGTVVVANTSVTASTRIFLSHANTSGTLGHLYVSATSAGVSFTITSSSGTDTSTVNWLLIEPK